MKVLVTGGSGLVGSAVKKLRPDWCYVDSKTYGSLTEQQNVHNMFVKEGPFDAVVHLAANVGGLFKNMNKRQEMFEDNILMNTFVLREATRQNVRRVVTMLSTCIFPDGIDELTPSVLHKGPPHPSNEGYAYAKRVSEVHGRIVRETSNTWVTCLVPTNVYGPHDNFSLEDAHVVPALIHKAWLAKQKGEKLKMFGTGVAKRQFIHSDDLARIIVWAVELPENPPTEVVCCSDEEITIGHLAELIVGMMNCEGIEYTPGSDGQMRKRAIPGPGNFPRPEVTLGNGLHETIQWFEKEMEKGKQALRGVLDNEL